MNNTKIGSVVRWIASRVNWQGTVFNIEQRNGFKYLHCAVPGFPGFHEIRDDLTIFVS